MHTTPRGWGIRVVIAIGLLFPAVSFGFSNAVQVPFNGGTAAGGSDCTACHTPTTTGTGSVQILGAPSFYAAGHLYSLTVRVEDPDQVGAGFQLTVESPTGTQVGTLTAPGADTQILSGMAGHTTTGVANSIANWVALGNAAEFQVLWQAPASDEGPATFWVAGNAINDAGGNNGDHVYTANYATAFLGNVPAVSEWGLMVMVMLLMTAGSILVGRRRAVPIRVRRGIRR